MRADYYEPKLTWILILIGLTMLAACSTGPRKTRQASEGDQTGKSIDDAEVEQPDPFTHGELAILGGDGNIYLADIFSGESVALTDDAVLDPQEGESFISYSEPTWSPAGDQLAVIRSERASAASIDVRILVYGLGMEQVELSVDQQRPFYLYWSPQGDVLSFLASHPGEPISFWIKDLANQGERIDQGQPYYWDWAPDGSRVLVHVGGSSAFDPDGAYLAFIDAFDDRRNLDLPPFTFQAPAYSPDGEYILVTSRPRTGAERLLMLDSEGVVLDDVAPVEGRASFDWSPDGSRFAVAVGPDLGGVHVGVLSLYRHSGVDAVEIIGRIAEDVIAFWWAPDGNQIAFFVPVLSPSDFTQPIAMLTQADNELFLQLFIYDLESGASRRLASFRPSSEFFRILPYYDQYQRSATIWSKDSSLLTYAAVSSSGDQIFIVDAEGVEAPVRIAAGAIAFWSGR